MAAGNITQNIRDPKSKPRQGVETIPLFATIAVEGIDHNTTSSSKFGDYYRHALLFGPSSKGWPKIVHPNDPVMNLWDT